MKQTLTLSIDARIRDKAKESLNNISKEVEQFLESRIDEDFPERFQEIKETIEKKQVILNEKKTELRKLENDIQEKEESVRNIEGQIRDLKQRLDRIRDKEENKLSNGQEYNKEYVSDKWGEKEKILKVSVIESQKCNSCESEIKDSTLCQFNEAEGIFICEECYKKLPNETERQRKLRNEYTRAVLREDL